MQGGSFQECRYFVDFKEEFSKYQSVYFLKKISAVSEKQKIFLADARTLGFSEKELLTYGGGEFDCNVSSLNFVMRSGANFN